MIGFALSEDQAAAQKWAHEFAEREIRPVAPHYDGTEDFPWPVLSKAADIGLYGMDFYRMIGEDETGILRPCWSRSSAGAARASPLASSAAACPWSP